MAGGTVGYLDTVIGHCCNAQKEGFFLPFKLPSKIIFVSIAFFCQELTVTALTYILKLRRLK